MKDVQDLAITNFYFIRPKQLGFIQKLILKLFKLTLDTRTMQDFRVNKKGETELL